ncbi:hypothetical protein [Salinicoccus sp. HZC-1]
MKVKTFSALTEKRIDKKVNGFLQENTHIEIIDMKFTSMSVYAVFIIYND